MRRGGSILLVTVLCGMISATPASAQNADLLARVDRLLRSEAACHYSRTVDDRVGGFTQEFDVAWKPRPDARQTRSIVMQARYTWTAATLAMQDVDNADRYKPIARHGLDFLEKTLWDPQAGGFYWSLDLQGKPVAGDGAQKHAYGQAFAIYALVAVYEATQEPRALALARRAFTWLDEHAHDAEHGGYIEALDETGKPLAGTANDALGTANGRKSMNSHIHLLEAFAALYRVDPSPALKARLEEVFEIVRDRVYVQPGYLNLFFARDWQPVAGIDSYGHDVETTYLLLEAGEALGIADDAKTASVARSLIDHALANGWDADHGGFYDEGSPDGRDLKRDKVWWVQAEGLNALWLAHEKWGSETKRYHDAFLKQLDFIEQHQVDAKSGGLFWSVTADGSEAIDSTKASAWKGPYHSCRALMNVRRMLKSAR